MFWPAESWTDLEWGDCGYSAFKRRPGCVWTVRFWDRCKMTQAD